MAKKTTRIRDRILHKESSHEKRGRSYTIIICNLCGIDSGEERFVCLGKIGENYNEDFIITVIALIVRGALYLM